MKSAVLRATAVCALGLGPMLPVACADEDDTCLEQSEAAQVFDAGLGGGGFAARAGTGAGAGMGGFSGSGGFGGGRGGTGGSGGFSGVGGFGTGATGGTFGRGGGPFGIGGQPPVVIDGC